MNSEFLWYIALILLIFLVIFCLWDDWRKRKKKSEDDAARAVERRVRIDESKHRLNKKVSALTQSFCTPPVSKPRRKISETENKTISTEIDVGSGILMGALLSEVVHSSRVPDSDYSGGGGSFGGGGASGSWDSSPSSPDSGGSDSSSSSSSSD